MSLTLQVGGVQYDSFVSASVEIRLDALSNLFSFELSSKDGRPLPFLGGEAAQVFVDGERVLTGYIERVTASVDDTSHSVNVAGRDRTSDLVDSTLDSFSDLVAPISLKTIIERTIKNIGSRLSVIDQANPTDFNPAEDLASPEPGDNAFGFIEKLARKRQVMLTSNGDGNVVITRGSGTVIPGAALIHQVDNRGNNVMSSEVEYDLSDRFRTYKSPSQLNLVPLDQAGDTTIESIVDQGSADEARAIDTEVRAGRQMVLAAESSFSDGQAQKRAEWERNIRKARAAVYSAVVDGYRNQVGQLWDVNQVVRVLDDYAGLNAMMLVNSVAFGLTEDEGSTTTLSLVRRNAYSLALAEPSDEDEGIGLTTQGEDPEEGEE